MKKNILARTNILVCVIIIIGVTLTAVLGYRANYDASLQSIEQVSDLTSQGIYYQMTTTFTKPVNISLTMANDSLLRNFLIEEKRELDNAQYVDTLKEYLGIYREKYNYDSVFLVSAASGRYYNFNGMDRVLTRDNPENVWFFSLMDSADEYRLEVDNDEVLGAHNQINLFVNCKIKDTGRSVLGVVGIGLHIDTLQNLLDSYQSQFDVSACLVNNDGIIEISPDYTGYDPVSLFDKRPFDKEARSQILDCASGGEPHSLWTQVGEDNSYLVTRYIAELEWHLVVERDTGALLAEMYRQIFVTVLIIALIIGIILLIITAAIRSFNRQIVTLVQAVEQERHTAFEQATEQLYEDIYELDITHNCPANRATEEYFESMGAPPHTPYDKALRIVAQKQIEAEYRQGYIDTFLPENVLRAYENGQNTLNYDFKITNDGKTYYWMRIIARIIRLESDGSIHMLTYRQIIETEKRMQELAQTDEMTGLLNKTSTQRRIDEQLGESGGAGGAFYILDIDNFKQANDLYGHAFGDSVIREFARLLRLHFSPHVILGRIGGDEFAAFVPDVDEQWAEIKAQELNDCLHRTHRMENKAWNMSASIGVAFSPKDGESFDALYRCADVVLYETKRRGRNGYTLYILGRKEPSDGEGKE